MKKLPISLTSTEKTLGWVYWALQLLAIPVALQFLAEFFHWPFSEAELNFVYLAFNFVCLTLIMSQFLGQSAKLGLKQPFLTLRWAGIGYVLNWLFAIAFGFLVSRLLPQYVNANDAVIGQMATGNYAITAISTVLLAPIAEELMYRGLIFGTIHRRSPVAAYIVSCLVFASIHVIGYIGVYSPIELVVSTLQYIPSGLCLALSYARSGNIWAPILMHMAINQTSMLLMR